MSQNEKFSIPRSRRNERGQVVIWVVCIWVVFVIAMAAVVCDLGYVYCCYRQLQASTDAAALAGAEALPTATATVATSTAQLYGSYSGEKNLYTDMTILSVPSVTLGCSTTEKNLGIICTNPAAANVVTVTQTAKVPLNFLSFFTQALHGSPTLNIAATSEAVMKGAPGPPFNVAIIMDTTASMNSGTNSCGASYTPIECAREGMQYLLNELAPCAGNVSPCGSAPPVDVVSLFVFPAWTTASAPSAWCAGGAASGQHYYEALGGGPNNIPAAPGSEIQTPPGGSPITYQLIPFSNDYQTSDGAGLNPNSDLVKASGHPVGTNNGCLQAPGGAGTYYAGVIYAAQNALAYQKSLNPKSNNVMIILTDGDATSTCAQFTSPYNVYYTTTNPPSGCATPNGTTSFNSPNFMSATDECQQAIEAAWNATAQGTQVYTIGFASEASGCSSDTLNLGLSSAQYASLPWPLTPCDTIEYMASSPAYWFSDSASQCSANGPTAQPANTVQTIFPAIAANLTVSRLVPPGT
jgi:putative Flp pilus-assembly TadE/G-like protein